MQPVNWRLTSLVLLEGVFIMLAVLGAALVRLGGAAADPAVIWELVTKGALATAVTQFWLYAGDLYDLRIVRDRRELVVRTVNALARSSFSLALVYYWSPGLIIGRGVFAIAALTVIAVVAGWRLAFDWLAKRVVAGERLLIVGTTEAAIVLARELYERTELGVKLIGFIDPDPSRIGSPVINPGVIGSIIDIPSIVARHNVDRVVVSLADARGKLPMDLLLGMKLDGVRFDHLASVYEHYTGKIAVENLRPSWFVFSQGFRKSRVLRWVKRGIDVTAAVAGLIVALPILALVSVAIAVTSPGPVLFRQCRVGERGRHFTLYKFRSMRVDAEAATGAVWAQPGDPRVTPIGRFLRRSRLDEIPQLWNVLKGEMSLVGPRPERPEFVEQLTAAIPFYGQRHIVKPGLTGWAQVRYAYGASVEDALEKLQYELFYIKNLSLALDVFIMLKTVKAVLVGRGL